ncbi:MAG: WD40 repeat domain-containing serine/threonine protein kinase [Planctomycetota bacterium]
MSLAGKRVGEYVVEREIARGGQGIVLAAQHAERGLPVALKLLTDASPQPRKRFQQEARILAALSHPHLVRVHDLFEWSGLLCLALERIEGDSLEGLLRERGPFPVAEAARIALALAGALACCHRRGVIHRDLKPQNVLVERERARPVLVDFGLARRDQELLAAGSLDATRLSLTGEVMGTPRYMAPEQAAPGKLGPVGPATDVYGLGALLLALLTGQPPITAEGPPVVILHRVLSDPPPDLGALRPDAGPALAALVAACLAKDPAARPPDMAALARALAAATGLPVPAFADAPAPAPEAAADPAEEPPPTIGRPLDARAPRELGPYVLERLLGAGGMGAVYLGRHAVLGVRRALKVLELSRGETQVERFRREVEHLARVRDPHVVAVHEGGHRERWLWFAMDLIEGESLAELLERGPPPLPRALRLARGVAAGVAALHRRGLVHRDLKPHNVVVRRADETPVVIDLGLAVAPGLDQRLTRTGALVGTPHYMAPEQLRGAPADSAADVYALGLILFELVTGTMARGEAETPIELIAKVLTERTPPPSSVVEGLPPAVDELCARLLAKDAAERPRDAGEVEALLAALEERPAEGRSRRPGAPALALAAAVVLGGLALVAAAAARAREATTPAADAPPARAGVSEDDSGARALDRAAGERDPRRRARALEEWLAAHPAHVAAARARQALASARQAAGPRTLAAGRDVLQLAPLADERLALALIDRVVVWDAARDAQVHAFTTQGRGSFALEPDGRHALVFGANAPDLRRVDLVTGAATAGAEVPLAGITAAAFSPDLKWTVVGGLLPKGGRRAVFALPAEGGPRRLGEVRGEVRVLLFSDGRHVICGSGMDTSASDSLRADGGAEFDNALRVFDLQAPGRELRRLAVLSAVDALALAPDGASFFAGTNAGELSRYALPGLTPLDTFVARGARGDPEFGDGGVLLLAQPGAVRGIALGPDGLVHAVMGEIRKNQGGISVWTVTGERRRWEGGLPPVRALAFDASGGRLYLGTTRGVLERAVE